VGDTAAVGGAEVMVEGPDPECSLRDPNANWQVPKSGVIQIDFEDGPVETATRIPQLALDRILAEMSRRRGVASGDGSAGLLLQLTARTWRLDALSARKLLKAHGFFETLNSVALCVAELYISLRDLENRETLLQGLRDEEKKATIKLLGPLARLEMRRPDGRYSLDLSNRYQREVAARLYRHAQEQEAWLRKNKRKERDVSERGDGVCWRNVKLDSQPFKVPIKHWDLPTNSSVLEFDMTSFPRARGHPMTEDEFTLRFIPIFRQLIAPGNHERRISTFSRDAGCAVSWRQWLRRSDAELSVAMLKQLMLLLSRETDRIECVVVMASGLTDRHNIHEVLQHVGPAAASILRERLGWVNLMSPEHPDGWYTLDIANPEQCALMAVLATLIHAEHICESCRPPTEEELISAAAEAEEAAASKKKKKKPKKVKKPKCVESYNVVSCVFHPLGFQVPVEGEEVTPPQIDFRVPAKWMDADKLPKQGVLQVNYETRGPPDKKVRTDLAKALLKWKPPMDDEAGAGKGKKKKKKKK